MAQARISIPTHAIAEICRRHRIRHLGLFGSVLRDDFRPESDMDMLVKFEPDAQVGLFRLIEIQDELSALLGHPVDLVPRQSLKRVIRATVLASEQVVYSI